MDAVIAMAGGHQTTSGRVLMVHWDGGGNVPPQRALARELVRRGYDVHVASHTSLAARVIADGTVFHPLAGAQQFDSTARRSSEKELAFLVDHVWSAATFANDVAGLHAQLSPDICLVDAMLVSTLHRLAQGGRRFIAINHLAWSPDSACAGLLDALSRRVAGDETDFTTLLGAASSVIATTFAEFNTGADALPRVHFVGPIREPVEPPSWPRRFPERPLILVSLSTMFQEQDETLRAICRALAGLPVEAVVTTGPAIAPEKLPAAPNLRIEPAIVHDLILPFVDLAISHGGLGTAMFSAGAGVPMLLLPNGRDQVDNAAMIRTLGLGRVLSRNAASAEIARQTMSALGDPALRTACRSFAARQRRFGDLGKAAELVTAAAESRDPTRATDRAHAAG